MHSTNNFHAWNRIFTQIKFQYIPAIAGTSMSDPQYMPAIASTSMSDPQYIATIASAGMNENHQQHNQDDIQYCVSWFIAITLLLPTSLNTEIILTLSLIGQSTLNIFYQQFENLYN